MVLLHPCPGPPPASGPAPGPPGSTAARAAARAATSALERRPPARAFALPPGEDGGADEALLAGLAARHRPKDPLAARLVPRLASGMWRQRRADRLEAEALRERGRATADLGAPRVGGAAGFAAVARHQGPAGAVAVPPARGGRARRGRARAKRTRGAARGGGGAPPGPARPQKLGDASNEPEEPAPPAERFGATNPNARPAPTAGCHAERGVRRSRAGARAPRS